MVVQVGESLLPLPSASLPSKDLPHVSPVGLAKAAARRLSNALPYQWQYSFHKDDSGLSEAFSKVDLSINSTLPQWVGEKKPQEVLPSQLCPGGFPMISGGDFEDEVRFDPLETRPSLLPSHLGRIRRPQSSSSSLSDMSDESSSSSSCQTADVLSLGPGSLLLNLHNCRDASKVTCTHPEVEIKDQQGLSLSAAFLGSTTTTSSRPNDIPKQARRKSCPRRFLGTNLERSPRQLPLFNWNPMVNNNNSGPATPELQAPGWKQIDYFTPPTTTINGTRLSEPSSDIPEVEGESSDDDGTWFTAAQVDQICKPFDRRPSRVAELESLRPAGGVGLDGRARAMSHPW